MKFTKTRAIVATWCLLAGAWPIAPATASHQDLSQWVLVLDMGVHIFGGWLLYRMAKKAWHDFHRNFVVKVTITPRPHPSRPEDHEGYWN